MRLSSRKGYIPYLFILPFLLSSFLFFIVPSVYSLVLSFAKYSGYGTIKWVGFSNYINIFKYSRFWDAFLRTLFYWIVKFVPVTVISFLLAVCLHSELVGNMSKIYKPVLFLPQVVATTAASLVFMVLFSTNTGVINQLFGTNESWLQSRIYSKWVVLLLLSWRGIGWFLVVYLSGLTSIPPEVNEACIIEGTNAFQRLVYIKIPLMKQFFLFAFVMDTISSLRMFTEAAVLTSPVEGGRALEVAEGMINLMISNLGAGNFGLSSSYGWILFILTFISSMIILRMFRERKDT